MPFWCPDQANPLELLPSVHWQLSKKKGVEGHFQNASMRKNKQQLRAGSGRMLKSKSKIVSIDWKRGKTEEMNEMEETYTIRTARGKEKCGH